MSIGTRSENVLSRDRQIIRVSLVGIAANLLLAGFKVFVGLLSNSIAIILDAVNNLSDAASSVITIVGTKLAGRSPDKKHPFGYGRIEYLSAMVISMIVLYAGITSLVESVKKIIHPEVPDYSAVTLVIVAVAVFVKIFLGRYVKAQGVKLNSDSLVNSGEDATLDSLISSATLAAALIFIFTKISLEAWLGAIISVIIIKSGLEMLRDTLSKILGEKIEPELARNIKKIIQDFEGVRGVYDLILNNYGPDNYNGSVHIEVPDVYTADQIDRLVRDIQVKVYEELDVILTAVGVYAYNTQNLEATKARKEVMKIAKSYKNVLQVHGFYLDEAEKTIRFDTVISFDEEDRYALFNEIMGKVEEKFPEYRIIGALDTDYSEV
ncbi:MAG: cation transporter [Lachnospiraceae bacterium]|nr:cation transporter [Lachnospiraceae bacterium]